jgi:hypothetical protein
MLLVDDDDAEREYDHDRGTEEALAEATLVEHMITAIAVIRG